MSMTFVLLEDPDTGREQMLDDNGFILKNIHPREKCAHELCVIHNPSEHAMRSWPMWWRDDRKMFERICEHGVGHPDPDQAEYLAARGGSMLHGCDGCCR